MTNYLQESTSKEDEVYFGSGVWSFRPVDTIHRGDPDAKGQEEVLLVGVVSLFPFRSILNDLS